MWLLAGLASAHPGSFRVAAHDLTVVVDADAVRLHYTLEAPRLAHLHDTPADEVVPGPAELLSGLVVQADGLSLPVSIEGEPAVRDSHTAVTLNATVVAPLPENVHQITVANANYPQLAGLFRTEWGLGPRWRMVGGSMVHRDDRGRLVLIAPTDWITEETARESRLDITPRAAWEAWTVPVYDEPVTAVTTARPSLPVAWRDGVAHPLMAVLPILAAPLAGLSIRMPKRARAAGVRAAIAIGVGLAGMAASLWLPHGVIVGALVVGIVASGVTRWGVPAALAALMGLAAMPPLWPWALIVGLAGSIAVHRREPNRLETVGVVMALGVAVLWTIRWVL